MQCRRNAKMNIKHCAVTAIPTYCYAVHEQGRLVVYSQAGAEISLCKPHSNQNGCNRFNKPTDQPTHQQTNQLIWRLT